MKADAEYYPGYTFSNNITLNDKESSGSSFVKHKLKRILWKKLQILQWTSWDECLFTLDFLKTVSPKMKYFDSQSYRIKSQLKNDFIINVLFTHELLTETPTAAAFLLGLTSRM